MTARDRTVLLVVAGIAAIAAFWFLALSPKREEAATLGAQISEARSQLETARQGALDAESARAQYDRDYATVARLGKAVPADDDVPSLVYQLERAADAAGVDFRAIRLEASAAPAPTTGTPAQNAAAVGAAENGQAPAGAAPTEAAAATLPPGATIGSAGFPVMPFSFTFHGSFRKLEGFLDRVKAFTDVDGETIRVSGRLLTIDGLSLTPGPKGFPQMSAQIAATAYLLPAGQATVPTAGTAPGGTAPAAGATGTTTPAAATGGTP